MAEAFKDSGKITSRLATALCQAGDVELDLGRLNIKLEGSSYLVSRCFVTLVRSGVASLGIRTHVEASGLADTLRDKPQGTRMQMHGYTTVATELTQRSERAFQHQHGAW